MRDIKIVDDTDSGDWQAIYVDGALLYEDHYLEADRVLDVLGVGFEYVRALTDDSGHFPKRFADVTTERESRRRELLEEAERLREQAEILEAEAAGV